MQVVLIDGDVPDPTFARHHPALDALTWERRLDLRRATSALPPYPPGDHALMCASLLASQVGGPAHGAASIELVSIAMPVDGEAQLEALRWALDQPGPLRDPRLRRAPRPRARVVLVTLSLRASASALATLAVAGLGQILVVVAGGNRREGEPPIAAALPGALTVGASADSAEGPSRVAPFSYCGVDLFAPGMDLLVPCANPTFPSRRWHRARGTSLSAALVAGAAARLLQADAGLGADEIRELLIKTASPLADPEAGGKGELDLAAALAAVARRQGTAGGLRGRLDG